jgi:hemolysin III
VVDGSVNLTMRVKPRLRGVFHQWAFFAAVVAGSVLVVAAPDGRATLACAIYAATVVGLFGVSAVYHRVNWVSETARRWMRRLDHSMIFLLIAGTYTPFALLAIGGAWGAGLLAFVWTVAAGGIAAELLGLRRHGHLSVAAYLLLGWCILPALGPLAAAVSPSGVALLAVGGVLYSVGVVFHLWRSLPYQNAIWHGFVLAGAACHYAAVVREVAAAT